MRRTLPQIFMLNHASVINSQRSDERMEFQKKQKEEAAKKQKERDEKDPIMPGTGGRRLSQLSSEEIARQFTQW